MPYIHPHLVIAGRTHSKVVRGGGMGSILLNKGGSGSGSSYLSPEEYTDTTGQKIGGSGLGGKLDRLMVRPLVQKKVRNIRF